jgi:chromosome segregation ATPase
VGSLLKKWTTFEKLKAAERREWLDIKQSLLEEKENAIGELDAKTQKLMDDTKELYATVEAHTDANIKVQEDLNA